MDGSAGQLIALGYDLQRVDDVQTATALREPDIFFTAAELATFSAATAPTESCAGAFAAKEALFKAIRPDGGWFWTDAELTHDHRGAPAFRVHGRLAEHVANSRLDLRVSISHSGGFAGAVVAVTRGRRPARPLFPTIDRRIRRGLHRLTARAHRAAE